MSGWQKAVDRWTKTWKESVVLRAVHGTSPPALVVEGEMGKGVDGRGFGLTEVLTWQFPRETEGKYRKKCQSG